MIKECCENQRPFQFGTNVYVYKFKPRIDAAIELNKAVGSVVDIGISWPDRYFKDCTSYDMVSREFLMTNNSDHSMASVLLTPKITQFTSLRNRGENSPDNDSSRGVGNLAGDDSTS